MYTTSACFAPYPFPASLTPADTAHQRTESLPDGTLIPADLSPAVREHAAAIARASKRLVDLRDAWLNPPEWTERVPEVVPLGMDQSPYPDRVVARPGFEKELAKRTLTNLYNHRPAWLAQAHDTLDTAVAVAYGWTGWTPAMPDGEILHRLLVLNLARSTGAGAAKPSMPAGVICMSERLPKHFDDALHAANLALRFVGGRSLEQYLADDLIRSAVERQVEIVCSTTVLHWSGP